MMAENEQPTGIDWSDKRFTPINYPIGWVYQAGDIRVWGSGNVMPPGYTPPEPKSEPKVIEADPLVLEGALSLHYDADMEDISIGVGSEDLMDSIIERFVEPKYLWGVLESNRRFRITVELLPEEGGAQDE